jgi:hypothetical protein
MTTRHPVAKAVLSALGRAWPQALTIDELAGGGAPDQTGPAAAMPGYRGMVREILRGLTSAGLVDVHSRRLPCTPSPGGRPAVTELARHQAAHGALVTTLRHGSVSFTDDLSRHLVTLLDGTRDRAGVLEELEGAIVAGTVRPPENVRLTSELLEEKLRSLGQLALLTA